MAALTHRVAEERSLALHREVARRLREAPELVVIARRRVRLWLASGSVPEHWAARWGEILEGSLDEVIAALTDPGEEACDLRQASPFAGALEPRTRWAILRRHRASESRP
jgi:hypothetical protein